MEKKIDYNSLYSLQDEILSLVSKTDTAFYLTGGTALHRFYYGARYSDDLDFFVTQGDNFSEDVKEIIETIDNHDYKVVGDVKSRDFYRIIVDDRLQIDFVNDRVYRHKKSNIINKVRVDNKINILTNKISTIINRDEEKDVFDLFCFCYNEEFSWKEMFEIANKKAYIDKEIFLYRLSIFPLEWLQRIKKIKSIEITKETIGKVYNDILNDKDNSLKK